VSRSIIEWLRGNGGKTSQERSFIGNTHNLPHLQMAASFLHLYSKKTNVVGGVEGTD